jgi:hypothetical protein
MYAPLTLFSTYPHHPDASLDERLRIDVFLSPCSFIFRGLGSLADDLIVSSARYIRFCNAEGVRKIERNLLALQQSLKTLVDDPLGVDFERARSYWSLFFVGPNVRAFLLSLSH